MELVLGILGPLQEIAEPGRANFPTALAEGAPLLAVDRASGSLRR